MQLTGKKKRIWFLLRILVVCIIFAVIATRIDFQETGSIIRNTSAGPFLIALLLFLINRVLTAGKWDMLLRHNGIHAGLLNLVRTMFVSGFLGIMMPSGVGVDIIRLVQVGREKRNLTASAGSVLADRMLAIMALSCMSVLAAVISWHLVEEKRALIFVLVFGIALIVLIFGVMGKPCFRIYTVLHDRSFGFLKNRGFLKSNRAYALSDKIKDKVAEIHGSFQGLLRKPALFGTVLAMNLLVQFFRVAQIHFLFRAMETPVPVIFEVTFVPIIILLTLLPVSPFLGIGVKEGAFVYFFSNVNVLPEIAVSVSLLSHLIVIAGLIPGAILFFLRRQQK